MTASSPSDMPKADHWTLDKKFPIAIILTMVLQGLIGVWVASAFYTQTQANQQKNEERFVLIQKARDTDDQKFSDVQKVQTDILVQLGVMNEKLNTIIKKGPNN